LGSLSFAFSGKEMDVRLKQARLSFSVLSTHGLSFMQEREIENVEEKIAPRIARGVIYILPGNWH
jgi:hypothetical protein